MSERYYPPEQDLGFRMTTETEERELFLKAHAGDNEAKEFLIRNHLLFAATQARRMSKGRLPENEVVSAANFALMTAFYKFDPLRNTRFTTYLKPFIHGAICHLWRSKSLVDYGNDFPGLAGSGTQRSSLGTCFGAEDVVYQEYEQEDELEFAGTALAQCAQDLTAAEQLLLHRVYKEERTFAEIGRMLDPVIGREAVRVRHNNLMRKLRRLMSDRGVTKL